MNYNAMLQEIGDFGWYQKKLCIIIFLAGIPNAFFVVSTAFTQFETSYHCRLYATSGDGLVVKSAGTKLHTEITWKSDQCEFYDIRNFNESSRDNHTSVEKIPCTGWDYGDNNTAIAEFDLVCDDAWKPAFVVTLYMIGMTIGPLTGKVCDRFGRRPIYLFFAYLQFAAAGFTGCAWNFESYAFGTFIMGICGFMGYNIAITLSTEMVGSRRQGVMAIVILMSYITGFLLSPLTAFLLPCWRWYLRFCGLVGIVYFLPLFWFFPESIRWQIISGRTGMAKKSVRAISEANGKTVDVDELFSSLQIYSKADGASTTDVAKANEDSLIQIYLKSAALRNRLLTLKFYWAVSVLLYFALSLNPVNPDSSRYVHVMLVGLAEIPGYTFGYLTSRYLGGRWCLVLSIGLAGIACLAIPLFVTSFQTVTLGVMTFLGKCFCASGYAYVTVYVPRMAPTLVRQTAAGTAAAAGKIGGIVMPYLMHTGVTNSHDLPYYVMGCLAFLSALLVLLFIPDSRDVPDTVADAESNQSNYLAVIQRKLRFHKDREQTTEVHEKSQAEALLLSESHTAGNPISIA